MSVLLAVRCTGIVRFLLPFISCFVNFCCKLISHSFPFKTSDQLSRCQDRKRETRKICCNRCTGASSRKLSHLSCAIHLTHCPHSFSGQCCPVNEWIILPGSSAKNITINCWVSWPDISKVPCYTAGLTDINPLQTHAGTLRAPGGWWPGSIRSVAHFAWLVIQSWSPPVRWPEKYI